MDQPPFTSTDALKYFLQHQETIDLSGLLKDFAVSEPENFFSFLEELTGKKPTQISAALVKARPETFMRFATGGKVKFEAARAVAFHMTQKPMEKVPAIKKIREAWGFGLKEAKDIADLLHDELASRGAQQPYGHSVPLGHLGAEQRDAYDYLKGHL